MVNTEDSKPDIPSIDEAIRELKENRNKNIDDKSIKQILLRPRVVVGLLFFYVIALLGAYLRFASTSPDRFLMWVSTIITTPLFLLLNVVVTRRLRAYDGLTWINSRGKIIVGLMLGAYIILMVGWSLVGWPSLLHHVLANKGVVTMAQVSNVRLTADGGRYASSDPQVTDFSQATHLTADVTYDYGHHTPIEVSLNQGTNNYRDLFEQMVSKGKIQVRYLSAYPQLVRPEVEFSDSQHNPYLDF